MLETWVQIPCEAGVKVLKKSQTAVSTTERYFTISVVCHIVECTRRQRKGNKKNIPIVLGRLARKWNEMSVLHLLLLKQKEVEQLFIYLTDFK